MATYFLEMEKNNDEMLYSFKNIEIYKKNGNWRFVKDGNNYNLTDRTNIFILPILEDEDLSSLIDVSFPIADLIKLALISNSEYWVEKALNQIVSLKLQGFKEELKSIEHDKNFSQKIRHLAKKLKYQSSK